MSSAESQPRSARRILLWVLLGLVFVTPMALNIYDHLTRKRSDLPDEKTAISQLLANKFADETYFQTGDSGTTIEPPLRQIHYVYISKKSALAQIDRVIARRKLSADAAGKLRDMINRLTELPQTRNVADERVNALLLNIALDALP